MLPKTKLLEYAFRMADALRKEDEKKAITSDYFVVTVLRTLSSLDDGILALELDSDECRAELKAAAELLKPYTTDKDAEADAIIAAVNETGYNAAMDEFVFAKYAFSADGFAKKKEISEISVPLYLEMILAEPTAAMKKHLLRAEGAPSGTSGDASGEKKEGETAETEMSGAERLAATVERTKSIQKMLLENVFGQDRAVNAFVSGYFQAELMSYARRGNKKPQATFLFAGPPGVGKTFLAEKAAEALGLPYQRFDMSEYADKEANIEFCGSDKVYKNGKEGNVTSFVAKNPRCVLLFDEVEKAHINVIYLFLQMLDAGRLRDNYTDEEVSFKDAVLIFTTNVGRNLYADPSVTNLSALPRKKILKALSTDIDPQRGTPLFPAAICSRFASGNVVMFNHLSASNLYTISRRELESNLIGFSASTGIRVSADSRIANAIMLSEGGKADARTVKGRANAFFYEEMYELFRLISAEKADATKNLEEIKITLSLDGAHSDVAAMFVNDAKDEILIFAEDAVAEKCTSQLKDVVCHVTSDIECAKDILFNHDVSFILCDINCRAKKSDVCVLNAEDIDSEGRSFLNYVLARYPQPVYLLQYEEGDISTEEFLSFAKLGVEDVVTLSTEEEPTFSDTIAEKCAIAYGRRNMLKLAKENKVLSYKTAQTLSDDGKLAQIRLFDFALALATDAEDSKSLLDNVSRPNVHFDDVIGAKDAKAELSYFVEYLKDPIRFLRKGVRAPKGVLLYGPPGTGKTLLAKAMAGESDVTFLTAEGNQFLKRYVGEGSEAVHDLFRTARKYAPAILFVDEIDAIGKDRNAQSQDNNSDVLTAFLTEMDGFNTDTTKPVFVLAATNYAVDESSAGAKKLDPALVRRFDRKILIDLPSKDERRQYLKMQISRHKNVTLSDEQIENIAIRSTGMSLAELEGVFEMALRSAIRSESGVVGDEAFEEAFETFQSGEKKEWSRETLERTARHEAGHALLCCLSGEIPSYLTIVARADHGGYMQHGDREDKPLYTKEELLSRIRTSLGGRAAELVYYGTEDGVSTGASGDLYSATRLAERMICAYGMDETVGLAYVGESAAVSPYYTVVRERINAILFEEMEKSIKAITENRAIIDRFVAALLEKNHLKGDEIEALFKGN